jgi:cell division protein FtsB
MKIPLKFRLLLVVLVVLAGAAFIIFNKNGALKYRELQHELERLNITADSLNHLNKRLEEEIDSLTRKVPAKIEQAAREKYDMMRRGETKVEVIER